MGSGGCGEGSGDEAELGPFGAGGRLGIGEVGNKALRRMDKGVRFVTGMGGEGGKSVGLLSLVGFERAAVRLRTRRVGGGGVGTGLGQF